MIKIITENHYLLKQLVKKDISQRYKGSILGGLWSVLVPLLMLAIYTVVFSEIFEAKWGTMTDDKYLFAMVLFCGLSAFNMLSEVMNRATTLIISHANYVKKVIFPLELLPVMTTVTALFNSVISFGVLLVGELVIYRRVPVTVILGVVNFIPLILLCVGVSLIISAMSVYLKDIANAISVIVTVLMYISPVFFALESVPENFRLICIWNPLTYIIENFRNVMLYGQGLNVSYFLIALGTSVLVYSVGFVVFRRTKEGFADVL